MSFSYGRRLALRELSLRLDSGVTGLLGPNGAGKTTLLNILATASRPERGKVVVAGHDTGTVAGRLAARRLLGFLPQEFELMGSERVAWNVQYAAWAHGVVESACAAAAARALGVVGLTDRANNRARTLSGGMRQRLGIACAIAHRPAVLLLDEPTAGLDPDQRVRMRSYLESVAGETTVLVSTHLVEDLAMIASRVAVLIDGRIGFVGSLEDFEAVGRESGGAADRFASPLEASYRALVAGGGSEA